MSPHEQADHNKLCHELDELRGDIIPYGIHKLRSAPQRLLWVMEGHWDYLAILGLMNQQELAYWKCQPTYQDPSSPMEN